jgi:hypothetical protein
MKTVRDFLISSLGLFAAAAVGADAAAARPLAALAQQLTC